MKSSCSWVYLSPGRGLSGPCSLTHFWYAWTQTDGACKWDYDPTPHVQCADCHNVKLRSEINWGINCVMQMFACQSNWLTWLTGSVAFWYLFKSIHSLCTLVSAQNTIQYRPLTHGVWNSVMQHPRSSARTNTNTDRSWEGEFKCKCLSFTLILQNFCFLLSCK